jgi:hypothetical protein
MLPPARIEDSQWNVAESWFHTDQNAKTRAGRQTVQSFTSLFDQSEATGGFVVVPRSWKSHKKVTARVYRHNPRTADSQQFLMIPPDDPVLSTPHAPHLVRCRAGDAVLWDSRTVHCSTPSLRNVPGIVRSDGSDPARVVVYASMAPRRRASTEVILRRRRCSRARRARIGPSRWRASSRPARWESCRAIQSAWLRALSRALSATRTSKLRIGWARRRTRHLPGLARSRTPWQRHEPERAWQRRRPVTTVIRSNRHGDWNSRTRGNLGASVKANGNVARPPWLLFARGIDADSGHCVKRDHNSTRARRIVC